MSSADSSTPESGRDVIKRPRRVPPRTLLFLLIGILSLVAVNVIERASAPENARARKIERGPSASEFQAVTSGETQTRIALAIVAMRERTSNSGAGASGDSFFSRTSVHTFLADAIKTYRGVLKTPASPNVARRILILEHLDGKPLDEALLSGDLPRDLRDLKTSARDIDQELRLWRGLYGKDASILPADAAARIDKMQLRLLANQALIDLYQRQGNTRQADEQRQIRDRAAIRFLVLAVLALIVGMLAFVTGLGLLLFFFQAALLRRLDTAGLVAPSAQRLDFLDLIDVFAFYFAVFESSRIIIPLILGLFVSTDKGATIDASNTPYLILELIAYLFPHVTAGIYLARLVKRRDARWDEVGLSARGLWANIGYGILGYCAALPLMYVLGRISERIFRNNPNVTPNPAMSLLAAKEDTLGRILLFFLISIAAPLCEELFFRGVLLSALRRRFNIPVSVLLSAVAFSAGHPIQDWLPILALGITFGTMREMRQSLVPSMTAHFLQNSMTYIFLSVLFGGS